MGHLNGQIRSILPALGLTLYYLQHRWTYNGVLCSKLPPELQTFFTTDNFFSIYAYFFHFC